jgi:hypothetical protein
MPKTHNNEGEDALHPVGKNFMVQCVGYRGLAHRNSAGQWKSIFGNKILPKKLSFIPPVEADAPALPAGQPTAPVVPTTSPVADDPE